MAFIISKISKKANKERKLYYLVRNYRENGKIKRKTLVKMFEEESIYTIFEKLEKNKKALDDNIKAYQDKILEVEKNKDDSKYFYAKLLLDSRIRRDNEKLNKVISTYGELKAMIEKYPLSSAKKTNIN